MKKYPESRIVSDLKLWVSEYENSIITAILIFIVPPIGLLYMWKVTKWIKFTKIITTIGIVIFYVYTFSVFIKALNY